MAWTIQDCGTASFHINKTISPGTIHKYNFTVPTSGTYTILSTVNSVTSGSVDTYGWISTSD